MANNVTSREEDVLARPELVPYVNNRSSRTVVDWKLLLTYNPPPGYIVKDESCKDGRGIRQGDCACAECSSDDKVAGILRNILRDLDKEIKDDKRRLKEEKKSKREERRKQRMARHESAILMTSDYGRRLFRQVSSGTFGQTAKTVQDKRHKFSEWKQKHFSLDGIKLKKRRSVLERSSSVTVGQYARSSWSRHSTDTDTSDTAEETEHTGDSTDQGSGYETVTSSVADFERHSDDVVPLEEREDVNVYDDCVESDTDTLESASECDDESKETKDIVKDKSDICHGENRHTESDLGHDSGAENWQTGGSFGHDSGAEQEIDLESIKNRNLAYLNKLKSLSVGKERKTSISSCHTDSSFESSTCDELSETFDNRNVILNKIDFNHNALTHSPDDANLKQPELQILLDNPRPHTARINKTKRLFTGERLSDVTLSQSLEIISSEKDTSPHTFLTQLRTRKDRSSSFRNDCVRTMLTTGWNSNSSECAKLSSVALDSRLTSNTIQKGVVRLHNETTTASICSVPLPSAGHSNIAYSDKSADTNSGVHSHEIAGGEIYISERRGTKLESIEKPNVCSPHLCSKRRSFSKSDTFPRVTKPPEHREGLTFSEATAASRAPFGKPLCQKQLWASIESTDNAGSDSRQPYDHMKADPSQISTESLYDDRVKTGFRPSIRDRKIDKTDVSSESLDTAKDHFEDTYSKVSFRIARASSVLLVNKRQFNCSASKSIGNKNTSRKGCEGEAVGKTDNEKVNKRLDFKRRHARLEEGVTNKFSDAGMNTSSLDRNDVIMRRASYRTLHDQPKNHVTGNRPRSAILPHSNEFQAEHLNISNGQFKMDDKTSPTDGAAAAPSTRASNIEMRMRSEILSGLRSNRRWRSSQSLGTSGYSTDESIEKTCESEDEPPCQQYLTDHVTLRRHKDRYFLVFNSQPTMAMKVDNPIMPDQETSQGLSPLLNYNSMSDLAIPDHLGWLTEQSEQRRVWCVVIDMLFCVFSDQQSEKAEAILLLPGCNIRPLVYKTAINGLHTRVQGKTITGIDKYQLVIDNASTCRKHIYSVESQVELDTWFSVLKRASALDPEVTNEVTSSSRRSSVCSEPGSFEYSSSQTGYTPSQNSQSRMEKLSGSQPSSPRDGPSSSCEGMQPGTNGLTNGNQAHPSPVGQRIVRRNSQSVQDFKKLLRREPEAESSKQQPLKARHFQPPSHEEPKTQQGKKLRSFGSFESLLKFKRKKKRHSEDSTSNDDTGSVVSTSSIEQDMTSSRTSVDIGAKESKMKKSKSKQLSRSLDLGQPKSGNGLVRRASDIKDKVFLRRPSKHSAKLGDLKDISMEGCLHHKTHLKWQKLWCVVCRGSFYGFKSSRSGDETATVSVVLANCVVVYVTEKDKRQKHLYVFKLSQENRRSVYLCTDNYKELQKWLTVLQMESNSVIANAHKIRRPYDSEGESITSSVSSQNSPRVASPTGSVNTDDGTTSRSRSKKKKKQAPVKPPRHSSCPPAQSRDLSSDRGSSSSTTEGRSSSTADGRSSRFEVKSGDFYDPTEDIPQHDKALTHVWQNDRGYLFNIIRSKLRAYRKQDGDIYNTDLPGPGNEGLLLLQENGQKVSGF